MDCAKLSSFVRVEVLFDWLSSMVIRFVIPFIFYIVAVFAFYAFVHLIPLEAHNPFLPYCDLCKEHLPYEKKSIMLYD